MKRTQPPSRVGQDAAAELAIAALVFLASEAERLEPFLAQTGLGPQSLRAAAREPAFLLAVLDHVAGNEDLLMAFASENSIDPLDVERARAALAPRPGDTGAA